MAYKQLSMAAWNMHALKNSAILSKSFAKCMSSAAASGLNVGFVGLGNMGARMANNLIKKVIASQRYRNQFMISHLNEFAI